MRSRSLAFWRAGSSSEIGRMVGVRKSSCQKRYIQGRALGEGEERERERERERETERERERERERETERERERERKEPEHTLARQRVGAAAGVVGLGDG
jgi:hypothetical protein